MNFTLVTKKTKAYQEEEAKWIKEAKEFLQLDIKNLFFYDIYEFENISEDAVDFIEHRIFEDCPAYEKWREIPSVADTSFRYTQVAGQFNAREEMVQEMVRLYCADVNLYHSRIVELPDISMEKLEIFKNYFINPVENRVIPMEGISHKPFISSRDELVPIENFNQMKEEELACFTQQFSMDLEDMKLCQKYFIEEKRNPNMTELKVIDTYWSDHCRHTTFLTELKEILVEEGKYQNIFEQAICSYLSTRKEVYPSNEKKKTLMDLGTINAKREKKRGNLEDLDESDEVNACSIVIDVKVEDQKEKWLLMFKNETHNHPTEIEPFGGASTCIGGGIRDPLSGRSYVYQGMRLTGSKDPRTSYEKVRNGKRSSRQICQVAMEGFSDYGNQIGLPAGMVREFYHDGFEAKRLELGALVAAVPYDYVVRKEPIPGDKILLLGGKTGRDGLGAAVGSSQVLSEESLERAGTEVQKGNPMVERRIMRLFRNPKATTLIKKCNDFGAGGVCVAIGELADGLQIDLDQVPVKYPGMHGGEIALSESQERMAVVIDQKDVAEFLKYAKEEDVETSIVAEVTDQGRMVMTFEDRVIIDLKRSFINSNGAPKEAFPRIAQPKADYFQSRKGTVQEKVQRSMGNINNGSQKNLIDNFDATINDNNLLNPLGGKYKLTPQLGMVATLPRVEGETSTASIMTYGYDPRLASWSPFHGGYYAVLEALGKAVALGGDYKKIRFSMQEYFERLGEDPYRWGKPTAALLGAFQVMKYFNLPAIGGKDSMSGSFEEIDVPPSLFAFAVGITEKDRVISREFKKEGSSIFLLRSPRTQEDLISLEKYEEMLNRIETGLKEGKILSISTGNHDGIIIDLFEMAFGNGLGFSIESPFVDQVFEKNVASFIIETEDEAYFQEIGEKIGKVTGEEASLGNESFKLQEIQSLWEQALKEIYEEAEVLEKEPKKIRELKLPHKSLRVIMPILPGSHGEYDLNRALSRRGGEVETFIFRSQSREEFKTSCKNFTRNLKNYDLIAFPDGAIMGNEPAMEGKFLELLLQEVEVQQEIDEFLRKGGKILGIGASFKALIQSGLIEFGKVKKGTRIEVLPNLRNKYLSKIMLSKIVKEEFAQETGEYNSILSTKYSRIRVPKDLCSCVISKMEGFYPGEMGVDGLISPCGNILGTLTNIERENIGKMKNITAQISPILNYLFL
ncbi:MAG: phosphoribosylformylglycinamidine synthase [Tissierellia bacterium]|nr:phosphoribosylformylglycinamidine synthase [Tissierellia bacterium]